MLFKEEISFPVIMRRQINYVDNILLKVLRVEAEYA